MSEGRRPEKLTNKSAGRHQVWFSQAGGAVHEASGVHCRLEVAWGIEICYFNHILISYSILDCYLQKNMPAKYRNTRRLSASDHIRQVVGDCSQSLYALRVHRHYGLTDVCLHTVFRSVVVAKLLYACTAWSGFVTASDRHRVDAFLRRSKRCGYCHLDLQQTSGGE